MTSAALQMAQSEPRALLRTWIPLGNPQLTEAEVHERLEAQLAYSPVESWIARAESYLERNTWPACAALGDRLWMVHWTSPIAPESPARRAARLQAALPHAHIVETEDGPINRPDLTAAVVRKAAAVARA